MHFDQYSLHFIAFHSKSIRVKRGAVINIEEYRAYQNAITVPCGQAGPEQMAVPQFNGVVLLRQLFKIQIAPVRHIQFLKLLDCGNLPRFDGFEPRHPFGSQGWSFGRSISWSGESIVINVITSNSLNSSTHPVQFSVGGFPIYLCALRAMTTRDKTGQKLLTFSELSFLITLRPSMIC